MTRLSLPFHSFIRRGIRGPCIHLRHSRVFSNPTAPPPPPLLFKLRTDLKTALQRKDAARLAVLRNLLADVTNAAKTSQPIATDLQLLSLLRKRAAAAKSASEEFKAAGREDLVQTEQQQGRILEEYAGHVSVMGVEELRAVIARVAGQITAAGTGKLKKGELMNKLCAPGGELHGKVVEKKEVARVVDDMLG